MDSMLWTKAELLPYLVWSRAGGRNRPKVSWIDKSKIQQKFLLGASREDVLKLSILKSSINYVKLSTYFSKDFFSTLCPPAQDPKSGQDGTLIHSFEVILLNFGHISSVAFITPSFPHTFIEKLLWSSTI